MKPCPYCLEDVKDNAVKCRYCQSSLRPDDDTSSRYVRYDIEQGVVQLAKLLIVAGGLAAFAGLVFFNIKLEDALEKASESKSKAADAEMAAGKAEVAAEKIKGETDTLLKSAEEKIASTTKLVEDATPKLEQFQSRMKKLDDIYIKFCIQDPTIPDGDCGTLAKVAENITRNQQSILDLGKRLVILEQVSDAKGPAASVNEPTTTASNKSKENSISSDTIMVKQIAEKSKVPPITNTSESNRTYYDLTFSICVKNDQQCGEGGLENVERVRYYFDPRWFSPSVVTTDNRADEFANHVQVWGRTTVTACIYVKGGTAPVVRSGLMSFNRASGYPLYWGPDTSKDGCSTSS